MRALRSHLSRGGDRPRAEAPAHPGRARGAAAQRNPALPLRALQQALRHQANGRRDDGKARGPFDVYAGRLAAAPADVRRLPRRGHDGFEERGVGAEAGSRFVSAEAVSVPVAIRRPVAPEEAARGDFYALLARMFVAAPDQALLASLAAAAPIPAEGDAALARAWQALVDASS